DAPLLPARHRLECLAKQVRRPQLDLDEDHALAFLGHDVDFAISAAIAARKNRVPLFAQPLDRKILAENAERLARVTRHASQRSIGMPCLQRRPKTMAGLKPVPTLAARPSDRRARRSAPAATRQREPPASRPRPSPRRPSDRTA